MLDAALTFSTDGLSYKLAATAMVVLGFVMLLRALHVAGQISRHKRRRCCSSWNISLILVRSFLVAYGAFLAIVLLQPGQATFVLTAAVFLGGAIFVWLVIKASVETVEEISRLIENAPDAIVLADVERNTIVDVNENACRLSGRPREAMIGANLNLLCGAPASEGRPSLGNVWRQQLGNNATSSFEWVCGSTSGNGTPCEVRLSELSEDGVSLLRISLVDISARRQAEMAMRMSQERFAKVFHGSPDYITITRLSDGMILDANEGFEQVCGWPREEAIGKTSLELGIWVDAAERDSAIQTIERDGGIRNHEFRFGRRDGTERVGLLSASTILDGTERLLVAIIRDMTELKQAQRALQAANDQLESRVAERTAELSASNEQLRTTLETLQYAQDELVRTEKLSSLGAMVAGIAHELNTPLGNSVMVASTFADKTRHFADDLAAGPIKRSALDTYVGLAREASAMLSQNLHQAAELITHFKQLAVDQTSAHRRDFDLAQVVGDVLLSMRPKLKKTPHQIDNTVPAGLRFDSFPGPLGQVLTNLINNALIHGLENIPAGTISITAQPMGDADIMLEVADNGTGIPKDIQSRIFDPFFTTRLGRGGSGLGLHLVFGIVTRVLGGQIQLISRPGVGTRFQIRIPRIAPQSTTEVLGKETP